MAAATTPLCRGAPSLPELKPTSHKLLSELRPHGRLRGLDHAGRQSEESTMRVRFLSTCTSGLAIALLLGAAPTARGQQQEPRRPTSQTRIPIRKDRPEPTPPAPVAPRVNQDSILAA